MPPKIIDEYIASFLDIVQKKLQKIRKQIKKTAPKAEETMGYGVPAFKPNGKYLVYYLSIKRF